MSVDGDDAVVTGSRGECDACSLGPTFSDGAIVEMRSRHHVDLINFVVTVPPSHALARYMDPLLKADSSGRCE